MIFSLGILEPVYSLIGDLNLYIVALIIVGSTMSMIRDMSAVGNSSGAPAENNEL